MTAHARFKEMKKGCIVSLCLRWAGELIMEPILLRLRHRQLTFLANLNVDRIAEKAKTGFGQPAPAESPMCPMCGQQSRSFEIT